MNLYKDLHLFGVRYGPEGNLHNTHLSIVSHISDNREKDDDEFQDTCSCELCNFHSGVNLTSIEDMTDCGCIFKNIQVDTESDRGIKNEKLNNTKEYVFDNNDDTDKESSCSGTDRNGKEVAFVYRNGSEDYAFTDNENDGDIDSSDDERDVFLDAVESTYV